MWEAEPILPYPRSVQYRADTTFKFKSTAPVEIVDIGGGTNGIAATATYSGKVRGVPISGKNLPMQIPAPLEAEDNLKQDWSFQLMIGNKLVNGKERTVASARLFLPNGDTIEFGERVVKYSSTKGYNLSFSKGMNTTSVPSRLDKKSSIKISNLTFAQQGNNWQPTGGTISYRLLGQRGMGNLLDFTP